MDLSGEQINDRISVFSSFSIESGIDDDDGDGDGNGGDKTSF